MEYYCEAFNKDGKRIGGFVVEAETMCGALGKASHNIEVAIRPDQYEVRVKRLEKS